MMVKEMAKRKKELNKKKELFGSSKETYWDYVGEEAKARVGNNMQLKVTIRLENLELKTFSMNPSSEAMLST